MKKYSNLIVLFELSMDTSVFCGKDKILNKVTEMTTSEIIYFSLLTPNDSQNLEPIY